MCGELNERGKRGITRGFDVFQGVYGQRLREGGGGQGGGGEDVGEDGCCHVRGGSNMCQLVT
jgi:hypothetical protein